ncbi:MAG TPA: hypothetical protein VM287_10645 [Egibacteraceae bacterium]|nr:hypothetical protein [Egibacteraceae bacterium]
MWSEDSLQRFDPYTGSAPDAAKLSAVPNGLEEGRGEGDDEEAELSAESGAGINGSQPRRVLKAHMEARRVVREARMRADEMLGEAHEQIERLHAEADRLREHLQGLREEQAEMEEGRQAALARLEEARVSRERVEYETGRRVTRVMAQATAEAAAIRSRAQQERSEAERALEALRREHAAYEAETGAIQARASQEIDRLRAEADALREELDGLRAEMGRVLEEGAHASQELRDAKADARRVEDARREAEWIVAEAKAELDMLRTKAASAQAELDGLQRMTSVRQEEVDALQAEARSLSEELSRMRTALADGRQREQQAVQHLEELRESSRRVEHEVLERANRAMAEAQAEADLIRSAAGQILCEASTEAERIRASHAANVTAHGGGSGQEPGTVADRLIGLQWDATTTSAEGATSRPDTTDPPRNGSVPWPISRPSGDADGEAPQELEERALDALSQLRHDLTSEIERRIAGMAAALEGTVQPVATPVGGAARHHETEGSPADQRSNPADQLEQLLAHVRVVMEEQLQGATAPGAGNPLAGDSDTGGTPDEESRGGERPQPLIGSGGWYATVPAVSRPVTHPVDDAATGGEIEVERGRRGRRGRRR